MREETSTRKGAPKVERLTFLGVQIELVGEAPSSRGSVNPRNEREIKERTSTRKGASKGDRLTFLGVLVELAGEAKTTD
jgi:hypothetical protein